LPTIGTMPVGSPITQANGATSATHDVGDQLGRAQAADFLVI